MEILYFLEAKAIIISSISSPANSKASWTSFQNMKDLTEKSQLGECYCWNVCGIELQKTIKKCKLVM